MRNGEKHYGSTPPAAALSYAFRTIRPWPELDISDNGGYGRNYKQPFQTRNGHIVPDAKFAMWQCKVTVNAT